VAVSKDRVKRSATGRAAIRAARRAQNLAAQGRAKLRGGATVLYYHRIDGADRDPWSLSVTPEHFAEQMAVLAESRRPLLTFGGMVAALREDRLPDWAVAVTFDDGYADNSTVAVPILEAAGVPATFFVTVDAVDADGELWWDELERIFLAEPVLPPTFAMTVSGQDLRVEVAGEGPVDPAWRSHEPTSSARANLFLRVWELLLTVDLDERDATMAALATWSGRPRTARPERRLMTTGELHELVESPASEVGSHTFRHPNLTVTADLEREVTASRGALAERIGRPVTTFAFPNGYHHPASVRAVADAGYVGACTTDPGVVSSGGSPYTVPRYAAPDLDHDDFRRFARALG
jgi:peptidoglycan/xylan/chitin deacetylase (PgdA/CDA1 family)